MSDHLRIEDEDACSLATELAEMTGESLDFIIASALRARFEQEMARRAQQERIMVITREIAMGASELAANDRIATAVRLAAAG